MQRILLHMRTTYYHVTPRRNVASILGYGVLVGCHTGKTVGVWVCDTLRLPWAVAHVSKHQGVAPQDVSILCIDNLSGAKRRIREGVWVTSEDVPAKNIGEVIYYALGEPQ
jgi:hypothetical protein